DQIVCVRSGRPAIQVLITEGIILRKAKRMNSNVRSAFSTIAGRKTKRTEYVEFLKKTPLQLEMFQRFLKHIKGY
ncbi:MAG: hypothetical protein JWO38_5859, partial [Gemmataceae bacterium]|nr:hypothetical protein [Gemmataceae bacterium]